MKHTQATVILFCYLSILACSDATESPHSIAPSHSVGTDSSSLPPKYLYIKEFKQCLGQTQPSTPGGAVFWCLPKRKPSLCPLSSWEQIKSEFRDHPCSAK